jgi:hypothetical protein
MTQKKQKRLLRKIKGKKEGKKYLPVPHLKRPLPPLAEIAGWCTLILYMYMCVFVCVCVCVYTYL